MIGGSHHERDERGRWLASTLDVALVVAATAAIAGWLTLALVHADDRYRIGHVQGHWMALAHYANEGTLYPPLFDGERFGGTRHMPLPILANALAARLTGDYLVSGKAAALMLFAALLGLLAATLRRLQCRWPFVVGLCGLLPVTNTGLLAGSAPGGDVLPVVLQMGALWLVTTALRGNSSTWLAAAGVAAGLAITSKLTGGWAALAIAGWLAARREWRLTAWFVGWCAAAAGLTLALVQWASGGRFLTTFLTLTFAGGSGSVGWIRAPSQFVYFGTEDASAVWMVAPFALLGVLAASRESAITLYHHALGWSTLLALVAFTDLGAGLNQLLDPAVLALCAVGLLVSRVAAEPRVALSLTTALAVVITWAAVTGIRGLVPDLRDAFTSIRSDQSRYDPAAFTGLVGPGETLLSEDPAIPVLLGLTPMVLDPFMLRRLDEVSPHMLDGFVARLGRGEFDRVVLIVPLDQEDRWWTEYHFGPRIVRALRASYVPAGRVDRYFLYRPGRP